MDHYQQKLFEVPHPDSLKYSICIMYPIHPCGGANQYYFKLSKFRHIFVCTIFWI